MSVSQENMSECLHDRSDSNNLQKSSLFHDKPMKNIAFSWFSLSELVQRSRHAYRGGRWRPACFFELAHRPVRDRLLRPGGGGGGGVITVSASKE